MATKVDETMLDGLTAHGKTPEALPEFQTAVQQPSYTLTVTHEGVSVKVRVRVDVSLPAAEQKQPKRGLSLKKVHSDHEVPFWSGRETMNKHGGLLRTPLAACRCVGAAASATRPFHVAPCIKFCTLASITNQAATRCS